MSHAVPVPRELVDAATVHHHRERIVRAVGRLAASPLSESAAGQMAEALRDAGSREVRDAIRRMARPGRPALVVVPDCAEVVEPADRTGRGRRRQMALTGGGAA